MKWIALILLFSVPVFADYSEYLTLKDAGITCEISKGSSVLDENSILSSDDLIENCPERMIVKTKANKNGHPAYLVILPIVIASQQDSEETGCFYAVRAFELHCVAKNQPPQSKQDEKEESEETETTNNLDQ
jgi:hypothetical protein